MILERSKHAPALLFEKIPNAREDMQILCSQIDGIERLALATVPCGQRCERWIEERSARQEIRFGAEGRSTTDTLMLVLLDQPQVERKNNYFCLATGCLLAALQASITLAQSNSIIMGYSGSGITSDLRRVIEKKNFGTNTGSMSKRFTSTAAAL